MEDRFTLAQQDDSLRFRVIAQRTLSQETVLLSVKVALLVSANQTDQSELQRWAKSALVQFVPNVEWGFSTLRRQSNAVVGYEQIEIEASARIPCDQNFNLKERAQLASREGLSISHVKVSYALPVYLVNEVVHELRLEIIHDLLKEIAHFEQLTGRKWRIGDVEFGITGRGDEYTAKGASRSTGYEAILDPDCEGLSGAEKISLVAEVCLRSDSTIEAGMRSGEF